MVSCVSFYVHHLILSFVHKLKSFTHILSACRIAGWKQREHPMLYNALHIGDQLLSVAGLSVVTAADAHRFIRASNSLYVS